MFLGLIVLMNWQLHKECGHGKSLPLSAEEREKKSLEQREWWIYSFLIFLSQLCLQTQSPSFNSRLWNWLQHLGPFIYRGEKYNCRRFTTMWGLKILACWPENKKSRLCKTVSWGNYREYKLDKKIRKKSCTWNCSVYLRKWPSK